MPWFLFQHFPVLPECGLSVNINSMKIRASGSSAFTLMEMMIAVGLNGLLAAIAIPNFLRARAASNRSTCFYMKHVVACPSGGKPTCKQAPDHVLPPTTQN